MTTPAVATSPAVTPPPGVLTQPYDQPVTPPSAPVANYTPALLSDAVSGITASNSPIMERAAAVADQQSNARGLLNSSMAVGAAQDAVLGAALPIAQGDVNAKNAALSQNTAAQNSEMMAQLGQANQLQLSGINTKYNAYLNSNNNASALYNNVLQQIGQIQNNPNMDSATKSSAIAQELALLESGLSMSSGITGLNLGAGLNFNQSAGQPGTTNYPANYSDNPDFMSWITNGLNSAPQPPGTNLASAMLGNAAFMNNAYQKWQAMTPAQRASGQGLAA